ncbi:MAG: DUF4373 domain-containing protein [Bacteroidales bacterium]|nr:DUF4373 domain-containing protein [Bacteroidales bacterium]
MYKFEHKTKDDMAEKLFDKHGINGYYVYYRLLEYMAETANTAVKATKEELAAKLSPIDYLDIINDMSELFEKELWEAGFIQLKEFKSKKHNGKTVEEITKGKRKFLDTVYLFQSDIDKLVDAYGEDITKKCIATLNDYKINKNGVATYKNDAAAIRSWVINKVLKEEGVSAPVKEKFRGLRK